MFVKNKRKKLYSLSLWSVMVTRASFCSPTEAPYGDLLLGVPKTKRNSSSSSWTVSSTKVTTHGFSFSPVNTEIQKMSTSWGHEWKAGQGTCWKKKRDLVETRWWMPQYWVVHHNPSWLGQIPGEYNRGLWTSDWCRHCGTPSPSPLHQPHPPCTLPP